MHIRKVILSELYISTTFVLILFHEANLHIISDMAK